LRAAQAILVFLGERREPWKNEDARANDTEEMFDAVPHDGVHEEFFFDDS
jgi:hypothetical protein